MQIAILAGGLATRLYPLTEQSPKSMLKVHGKPFLEHQIELLRKNDVTDIVLCVGHLAEQIYDYFDDGYRWGVHISYSDEGESHLGTAGALKLAESYLTESFFVLFGDSYLMLDYPSIMDHYRSSGCLGLMVVYHNANRYDSSDVLVEDGFVTAYDKEHPIPNMAYINHGLSVISRQALSMIPGVAPLSLQSFFQKLIPQRQLMALETKQRFYEIGSFDGLREFEQLVERHYPPAGGAAYSARDEHISATSAVLSATRGRMTG